MADQFVITINDNQWGEATIKDLKVTKAASPEFKELLELIISNISNPQWGETYRPDKENDIFNSLKAQFTSVKETGLDEPFVEDVIY